MKFTSQLFVAGLAPLAHAFPAMMYEAAAADPALEARAKELAKMLEARQAGADAATALFEPVNTFNAQKQFIDVGPGSGHEYVPPGSGDLRGPCPGLNAFANHSMYTPSAPERQVVDPHRLHPTQRLCHSPAIHRCD